MTVRVTVDDDRVGTIEVARPERRNALNLATCRALVSAAAEVRAAGARAVVVTGAGTSFSAGADLDGVYDAEFRKALAEALATVAALPLPVVAAVNGPAIGGGTQLALACDLRIAAPDAVFALPTARLGLAADPWTLRRLEQLAGGGTARALAVGAATIDAPLALARGLVDRIGTPAEARELAAELAGLAPLSLAYSKLVLDRTDLAPDAPELVAAFEACWGSADAAEGRAARTQRRAPVFEGR